MKTLLRYVLFHAAMLGQLVFAQTMSNPQNVPLSEYMTPEGCADTETMRRIHPIHTHCRVKLGLPKDEAAKVLTKRQRDFLDGIRRLYTEPALLLKKNEAVRLVGGFINSIQVNAFPNIQLPNGKKVKMSFAYMLMDTNEDERLLRPIQSHRPVYGYGIRPPWPASNDWYEWNAGLRVYFGGIDGSECIDSRAFEGYLDIPLSTNVWGYANMPRSPLKADRQGEGGSGTAKPLAPSLPQLELDMRQGCMWELRLSTTVTSKEFSYHDYDDFYN